jgi:hypothetical protein
VCVISLSECRHNFYLVGRTTGATGTARIVTAGNHSGDVSINLAGNVNSGRWVYRPGGGSIGFGTAGASSGVHTTTATGTMVGLPTGGNGSILASAAEGSTLRCVFQYSEWGSTGVGVCQDAKGEVYDLQINQQTFSASSAHRPQRTRAAMAAAFVAQCSYIQPHQLLVAGPTAGK